MPLGLRGGSALGSGGLCEGPGALAAFAAAHTRARGEEAALTACIRAPVGGIPL